MVKVFIEKKSTAPNSASVSIATRDKPAIIAGLAAGNINLYKDLKHFKSLIEGKIEKAQNDLALIKSAYMNDGDNGTEDTSPTFKAFEEGSQTMSKEANTQLAIRQEKFIRDLQAALIRIENKTYGVCRVTGKLINKKRLELVPHATLSIEAKNMQK